ncbi:MAG: hypothetical protein ABJC33_00095 [Betaproteobacteria bacterium]
MKNLLALGALAFALTGCVAVPVGDPYGYNGYTPYRSDGYAYAPGYSYDYYGYGYGGYGYGPGYYGPGYYGAPLFLSGSFFYRDFRRDHDFRRGHRGWGGWQSGDRGDARRWSGTWSGRGGNGLSSSAIGHNRGGSGGRR